MLRTGRLAGLGDGVTGVIHRTRAAAEAAMREPDPATGERRFVQLWET